MKTLFKLLLLAIFVFMLIAIGFIVISQIL